MRNLFLSFSLLLITPLVCVADDSECLVGCAAEPLRGAVADPDSKIGCGESLSEDTHAFPKLSDIFSEDCWLKFGGSYRIRHHDENNMRRAGLTGQSDDFTLHLTRVWFDAEVNDRLKIHAGFMDAASFGQTIAPRGNEVNRTDLYQLYADVVVGDSDDGKLTARLGRQELRYGSARLIMAPNWANRRRTHDGARLMYQAKDWDVDAFWVRPAVRNATTFNSFDTANQAQQLYGIFSTYKGMDDADLELYWLAFDVERGAGTGTQGAKYDTLGTRYFGKTGDYQFEFEGGYQFGENPDDSTHNAGFIVAGVGKAFEDATWAPELWFLYDWASGSDTVGNGFHTYVQRAHYYNGQMDMFGRRNLQDFNVRLTTKPTKKLTLVAWYHYFRLANGNDVPYNLSMNLFAGLPAGSAGSKDLGHELDLVATWNFNEQTQFRLAYHYFWSGRFYDKTAGVPYNGNADFLYGHVQYLF